MRKRKLLSVTEIHNNASGATIYQFVHDGSPLTARRFTFTKITRASYRRLRDKVLRSLVLFGEMDYSVENGTDCHFTYRTWTLTDTYFSRKESEHDKAHK